MRTLLAKCCVLALIAGGFAFTGDAGRVFARGRRVLESTTLPRHAADLPADSAAEPTAAAAVAATPPTTPPPDHTPASDALPEPRVPAADPVGSESAEAERPAEAPAP